MASPVRSRRGDAYEAHHTQPSGREYSDGHALSDDFPTTWRYVPLKLTRDRKKWVNAIPYRKLARDNNLGDFYGVDVAGNIHFENEVIPVGNGGIDGGIEALAHQDGYGVGIFMRYSEPGLVILDCDTQLDTVVEGGTATLKLRRGRDQLLSLFRRHKQVVPPCPVVRGNRPGHGYLIFQQNQAHPIRSRKIRPFGMALDVLGAGHQNHWTCGNRALVAGRETLADPPELPTWLAQLILRDRPTRGVTTDWATGSLVDPEGGDTWSRMFLTAVLREVTPRGPGWNQALFNAACTLAENGFPWEAVRNLIIERCEPVTPTDEMMALNSIASAWRRVTGEAVPE